MSSLFAEKIGYPAYVYPRLPPSLFELRRTSPAWQTTADTAPSSNELLMFFVYVLRSIDHPQEVYVGYTVNVENRLKEHNLGISFHRSKYKPWRLVTSIKFEDKSKALIFEKYLKSGSGRVFLKKYFL